MASSLADSGVGRESVCNLSPSVLVVHVLIPLADCCCRAVCSLFTVLYVLLPSLSHNDEILAAKFYRTVPSVYFLCSAAAFASSVVQNMLSLLFFESSPIKRQLALLQCLVKGLSMLADLQLGLGNSAIFRDSAGAP